MDQIIFPMPLVRIEDLGKTLSKIQLQTAKSIIDGSFLFEVEDGRLISSAELGDKNSNKFLCGGKALLCWLAEQNVFPPVYHSISASETVCRAQTENETLRLIAAVWPLRKCAGDLADCLEQNDPWRVCASSYAALFRAFSGVSWAFNAEPQVELHLAVPIVMPAEFVHRLNDEQFQTVMDLYKGTGVLSPQGILQFAPGTPDALYAGDAIIAYLKKQGIQIPAYRALPSKEILALARTETQLWDLASLLGDVYRNNETLRTRMEKGVQPSILRNDVFTLQNDVNLLLFNRFARRQAVLETRKKNKKRKHVLTCVFDLICYVWDGDTPNLLSLLLEHMGWKALSRT